MELTVENLYGLLLRSRLLTRDDARAMLDRWQAEAGERAGDGTRDAARFARWMVAHHYVTEYQAALLARGHADCFFLDGYRILERLGKGRMAGVYRAVHSTGQQVAIKVLPPSKARDPQLLARFQRETRLALSLDHPHVVRAFEVGEADGLHYLVMECLGGETLEEVLNKRGRLPVVEAARVTHQALLGLQHIHDRGLVHRDLKPGNLMMVPVSPEPTSPSAPRWTVKILDMSLGRALDESALAQKPSDPEITTAGMMLGTPDYMAPEQANDPRAASVRSDIYSIGCVLYHLVAGQSPFPDTSAISQMIRHATEVPRPLKDFIPTAPDGLQQILAWMMAKDPAQRYPSAERAARALRVFLAAAGGDDAAPPAETLAPAYLAYLRGRRPPASPETAEPSYPATTAAEAHGAAAEPPAAQPPPPLPAPAREVPSRAQPTASAASSPAGDRPAKPRPERPRKPDRSTPPASTPAAPPPVPPATPPSRAIETAPVEVAVEVAAGAADDLAFDVEMLPVPARTRPARPPRLSLFPLTWRDVILYLLGAATVLLAIPVGWLLSWLVRR